MFIVDGQIGTQRDPDAILGQYGFIHDVPMVDAMYGQARILRTGVFGTMEEVGDAAFAMIGNGVAPDGLNVEEISNRAEARRYGKLVIRSDIYVESTERPVLTEAVEAEAPETDELVFAKAALWKETRFPTPFLYNYKTNKMLEMAIRAPRTGWVKAELPSSLPSTFKAVKWTLAFGVNKPKKPTLFVGTAYDVE